MKRKELLWDYKHHITWIDIAFLFESSWLPAHIKQNTKIMNQARSNTYRLDFQIIYLFICFWARKIEGVKVWIGTLVNWTTMNGKLPFEAAFCFSMFFSRAIFAFCPLPPPMSDAAGWNPRDPNSLFSSHGSKSRRKRANANIWLNSQGPRNGNIWSHQALSFLLFFFLRGCGKFVFLMSFLNQFPMNFGFFYPLQLCTC